MFLIFLYFWFTQRQAKTFAKGNQGGNFPESDVPVVDKVVDSGCNREGPSQLISPFRGQHTTLCPPKFLCLRS